MGDLVVPGLHVLGPPVMLTEQEAMVGADNEQGILPEREFIHRIEHLAEIVVTHSSKNHSDLLTACCFRLQLRLFTKQPTRRQVTLRATSHRTAEYPCQMGDVTAEDVPRLLRFIGLVGSLPCCCFHVS